MRRLLLLLLAFLLPLQLLAATVGDLQPRSGQEQVVQATTEGHLCQLAQKTSPAVAVVVQASLETGASAGDDLSLSPDSGAGQNGDDDADPSAAQAELEDHTIPVRIATPDIPWQPFPHAFSAPLNWPSFVRDQLRPPPLA
ncbi:hypothetical protein [Herbaspirillum robiniae]|uniref:hypothetical protein n=1 Tax=Herbaspirillum robiniae TaxID=2014887 RepID=UPI003D76E215